MYKGELQTTLKICLKGVHNVYNSLAVWASLHIAGIDMELVANTLQHSSGMGRRFQKSASLTEFQSMTIMHTIRQQKLKATLSSSKSF